MTLLQKILDSIFPSKFLVVDDWLTMDADVGDRLGIYLITRPELRVNYFKSVDPDIIIFQTEDGKYGIQKYQETFSGSYWSPPEGDYFEIGGEYDKVDVTLASDLVKILVEEIIQDITLSHEMEQEDEK